MTSRDNKHWYRKLLKKYMKHVADCEGTNFVDRLNKDEFGCRVKDPSFTQIEEDRLKLIEQEIDGENE